MHFGTSGQRGEARQRTARLAGLAGRRSIGNPFIFWGFSRVGVNSSCGLVILHSPASFLVGRYLLQCCVLTFVSAKFLECCS